MSFTDGKTFAVTADQMKLNWGGKGTKRFRCRLCGVKFKEGSLVRWVFTNYEGSGCPGNPFVCNDCDGEDVKLRLAANYEEAYRRFWWLFERGRACGNNE